MSWDQFNEMMGKSKIPGPYPPPESPYGPKRDPVPPSVGDSGLVAKFFAGIVAGILGGIFIGLAIWFLLFIWGHII